MDEKLLKLNFIFKCADGLFFFKDENIDDHVKRNLLRYFFILIDSLLKIIGNVKNTLHKKGKITLDQKKKLEKSINKLKSDFDKSYDKIRDKFGAHHQQLCLLETIDWWNEIDNETLIIFYDDLSEIKGQLKSHGFDFESIDDYSPSCFTDTPLARKDGSSSYVSHDRLALTKQNTAGSIPIHRTQEKAQLILSIVDLTRSNFWLTKLFNDPQTNYRRVVFDVAWLQIICDTCALIDNLYEDICNHYIVSDSLLTLWKKEDIQGYRILQDAQKNSRNFQFEEQLRKVRNKIGAHLELEMTMERLIKLYEDVDLAKLHEYFWNHAHIFQCACSKDIRTQMFLIVNSKLKNAIGLSNSAYENFNEP